MADQKARVFVIQDVGRNYFPALKYGSLEAVLQKHEELNMVNIPSIVKKLRFGLATMTPDDYLIMVGNPVTIGLATAIASEITGGKFNVLKWDQQETDYIPMAINLKAA